MREQVGRAATSDRSSGSPGPGSSPSAAPGGGSSSGVAGPAGGEPSLSAPGDRSSSGPVASPAGHGRRPRGRSPFAAAAPSIAIALVYAAGVGAYLVAGPALPGDRWVAVHLFTLGVLTNLILVFSEHFARTVTRTNGERAAWWPVVTNLGIVAVLVGVVGDLVVLLAAGATTVTVAVFAAYLRLRRMRRRSLGARFAWIARVYERAHGSFIHGAILGALLGTGVLTGPWYGAAFSAHLHANVLGWAGLTLLATLVFFGPTMARTRIEPGADARASRALRIGATGLTVGVLLLLGTGFAGSLGVAARMGAAGGLAVFAWSVAAVCLPVVRAVARGRATASRPLLVALCGWFPLVVWADVAVVATGAWHWLDSLGGLALAGVVAQAILATLLYLTPMLRGRTTDARARITARLEWGMTARAVAFNLGVLAIAGGAAAGDGGSTVVVGGWSLLLTTLAVSAATAAWPIGQRAAD